MTQVLDSHRRCPRCHKRMTVEVGQHEETGEVEVVHHCESCGRRVRDTRWREPARVVTDLGRANAVDRLWRMRAQGRVPDA